MISVALRQRLDPSQVQAVADLASAEEQRTGRSPLNEDTRLHLGGESNSFRHLIALRGESIVGYAGVSTGQEPWIAEIADPGPGAVALELVRRLQGMSAGAGLQVWTHGSNSATAATLLELGFQPMRRLHTMRRSLREPVPPAALPIGYRIRTFTLGQDESDWLSANAASFIDLPDQGGWSGADLAARLAEPWFDAAGFFLAEAGPALAGFCWTKREDGIGEIYVMAVTPQHRGSGLAVPLLRRGLRHLREEGAREAVLFVDAANTAAVRLYEREGFSPTDVDVLFG